jgi:hypothetical protein
VRRAAGTRHVAEVAAWPAAEGNVTEAQDITDRQRLKLLFGPYKTPPLKRGDRAFCLFRDCEVIITSWTDAPISWPRCRAIDSSGPGSGLLVDEELARAVRHESATAVMHWWGSKSDSRFQLAQGAGHQPHRQRGDGQTSTRRDTEGGEGRLGS